MVRAVELAVGLIAFVAGEAHAAEQRVHLAKLKGAATKPDGRMLNISGHLDILGEVATLQVGSSDGKPILVELGGLPRELRRVITVKCNAGCEVRLSGTSGTVLHELGLVATSVALIERDAPPELASK